MSGVWTLSRPGRRGSNRAKRSNSMHRAFLPIPQASTLTVPCIVQTTQAVRLRPPAPAACCRAACCALGRPPALGRWTGWPFAQSWRPHRCRVLHPTVTLSDHTQRPPPDSPSQPRQPQTRWGHCPWPRIEPQITHRTHRHHSAFKRLTTPLPSFLFLVCNIVLSSVRSHQS